MSLYSLFHKYKLILSGLASGAAAGYAYYHYVGCVSGACPITSHPLGSTLYGALMGALVLQIFTGRQPKNQENENQ